MAAPGHPRHRLRAGRLPLEERQGRDPDPRAVGRHRPGRRCAGNKDEGAGDQGIMFGYACRETPELMPAPIYYAHSILRSLAEARHSGAEPGLGPDAKSQVTLHYDDGKPVRATSVVVSTQHGADLDQEPGARDRAAPCAERAAQGLDVPGGGVLRQSDRPLRHRRSRRRSPASPAARSSSTPMAAPRPMAAAPSRARIPTKVDRSAAYAARYLAKNVVAAGLAERCTDPALLRHRRLQAALGLCRHPRHRRGRRGPAVQGPAAR